MKSLYLACALVLCAASSSYAQKGHGGSHKATASGSGHEVHVRATTKKDGTYVPAHERTAPNATRLDNWSTKGNINPHTGKAGTVDPYKKP
jgi:hypothetical protein